MIQMIKTVNEWNELRAHLKGDLGFVPTMGALHRGHESLFEKSVAENSKTVVSIFVNPTQFNDKKDYDTYPVNLEQDLEILKQNKVDYLFFPQYETLYPDNFRYKVTEIEMSKTLCGAHRPGHFDGVLTVVMKLLMIIRAHKAYFGHKDFQQYLLIKDMCQAFFLKTQIIGCPTVREVDGLAMSSRNKLLSPAQRKVASEFPRILSSKLSSHQMKDELSTLGFMVDYIEDKFGRRLAAVRLGNVRLIDNVEL